MIEDFLSSPAENLTCILGAVALSEATSFEVSEGGLRDALMNVASALIPVTRCMAARIFRHVQHLETVDSPTIGGTERG